MKKRKNNLDEMQELEALKIGERSFWIMVWGLVAVILIQMLLYGQGGFEYVAGETGILVIGCGYSIVMDLRKGIWSRTLKASSKANLLVSLGASAGFAAILGVINYVQYGGMKTAFITAGIFFIFTFMLCYGILSVLTVVYKKKKEALENESDEE